MTLLPFCEEFCRINFLNMFKIFATTLRLLATHVRKLQITGDCFETALRPTRDVCRQHIAEWGKSKRRVVIHMCQHLEVWFFNPLCSNGLYLIQTDEIKIKLFIVYLYNM